jgi:hypothetical protein
MCREIPASIRQLLVKQKAPLENLTAAAEETAEIAVNDSIKRCPEG